MLKFGHTQALASAGGESLKGPKGVENPANEAPFGMRQMFQAIACGLVQHAGSLVRCLSSVQRSREKPYSQPNWTRVTNWNR